MDKEALNEEFLKDLERLPYKHIQINNISENGREAVLELYEHAVDGDVLRDMATTANMHHMNISMKEGKFIYS